MQGDRIRIPAADEYVAALGRAAYVFATTEWNAVWCCERMSSGYVRTVARKTAGLIANDLLSLARALPLGATHDQCVAAAKEFKGLVAIRNALLHGKPGSAADGAQQLFDKGQPWTIEAIDNAADKFAACGIILNGLMHGPLK